MGRWFGLVVVSLALGPAWGQAAFVPLGGVVAEDGMASVPLLSHFGVLVAGTSVVGSAAGAEVHAAQWRAAEGLESVLWVNGAPETVNLTGSDLGSMKVAGNMQVPGGTQGFYIHAWLGMFLLEDLVGGSSSAAWDLDDPGYLVVGDCASPSLDREGAVWIPGFTGQVTLHGLGPTGPPGPGGNWSSAFAVSDDGSTVLGKGLSANGLEYFLWTRAGGMQLIAGEGGTWEVKRALALNADGSVVAGQRAEPGGLGDEPVLWTASGVTALGNPDGQHSGIPVAVRGAGELVIGHAQSPGGRASSAAWLWTPVSGYEDLKDHLIANGAAGLEGWCLTEVHALSGAANCATGLGVDPSGQRRPWMAYFFGAPQLQVGETHCSPAQPNQAGQPARLRAIGSKHLANNCTSLLAEQLPSNQTGYFLNGSQLTSLPGAGGGQGTLCLAGSVGRYVRDGELRHSGNQGTFGLLLDLTDIPGASGTFAAVAGQTLYFQAWYRDENPGPTSNFTDVVGLSF